MSTPYFVSRDYATTRGRELMRWWNETGRSLPLAGESFRGWWEVTYQRLQDDWPGLGPDDVWEQLQHYASEAAEWATRNESYKGPPPPVFGDPEPPGLPVGLPVPSAAGIGGVLLAAALVVYLWKR